MTSDKVKTSKTTKFLRGWSSVTGVMSLLIGAWLQYKGIPPEVAAGFGALGLAKIVQPDEPIDLSKVGL